MSRCPAGLHRLPRRRGVPRCRVRAAGEGVTLILDGETEIKSGITYSRFETAPDAPVHDVETELPAGPKSILGAYASAKEPYNLCKANLAMPTEITARTARNQQNTT